MLVEDVCMKYSLLEVRTTLPDPNKKVVAC